MPRQVSIQTLNALKKDPQVYETHKRLIDAHNQLVGFVSPGDAVGGQALSSLGLGTANTLSISGTFNRGKITLVVGAAPATPATITLNFPEGTWTDAPFATVVKNGGTGTSAFSWTETVNALVLTIAAPVAGTTYTFQYAIRP